MWKVISTPKAGLKVRVARFWILTSSCGHMFNLWSWPLSFLIDHQDRWQHSMSLLCHAVLWCAVVVRAVLSICSRSRLFACAASLAACGHPIPYPQWAQLGRQSADTRSCHQPLVRNNTTQVGSHLSSAPVLSFSMYVQ
jgi:hypothetical protein